MRERRRLERDLHDGAQQRLVALNLSLALARSRCRSLAKTGSTKAENELRDALAELSGDRARHLPGRARGGGPVRRGGGTCGRDRRFDPRVGALRGATRSQRWRLRPTSSWRSSYDAGGCPPPSQRPAERDPGAVGGGRRRLSLRSRRSRGSRRRARWSPRRSSQGHCVWRFHARSHRRRRGSAAGGSWAGCWRRPGVQVVGMIGEPPKPDAQGRAHAPRRRSSSTSGCRRRIRTRASGGSRRRCSRRASGGGRPCAVALPRLPLCHALARASMPSGAGYLLKERVSDVAVLADALHRVS